MKFLVSGGAGFIGSNMVEFLTSNNHEVISIDNYSTGLRSNTSIKSTNYEMNISNSSIEYIKSLLKDVDYLIHMAATPNVQQSIDQPVLTHKNNFDTTLNLLEACRGTNVKKIIFSSTSAVYGEAETIPVNESAPEKPMSPYGLQKLLSEKYIKLYSELYGLKAVVFRYFNVFGNRMTNKGAYKSVISVFKEQYEKGLPLTITNDGNQRRDFINVVDVVKANYFACFADTNNFEIFNIGSGTNISVNEIANHFPSEKIYIGKRIEPFETLCDSGKAKKILNWFPTVSVADWLKETIK